MLLIILGVILAGLISLLFGAGEHFVRRTIVVASVFGIFIAMVLVVALVETICGIHPQFGLTCFYATAGMGGFLARVILAGKSYRIRRMWTPE